MPSAATISSLGLWHGIGRTVGKTLWSAKACSPLCPLLSLAHTGVTACPPTSHTRRESPPKPKIHYAEVFFCSRIDEFPLVQEMLLSRSRTTQPQYAANPPPRWVPE